MLFTTLKVLVPVLFVLLLGYLAGRAKAFDADQVAGVNELVLDFALPASLFVGIVSIPRTQIFQDLTVVLVILAALVGIYAVAFVVGTAMFGLSTSAAALFALGAGFPAAPFFGPAILEPLFGPKSAVAIASTAIAANLLLVPATVIILETGQRARRSSTKLVAVAAGAGQCSGVSNERPEIDAVPPPTGTIIRNGITHAVKQPYVWAPILALVLVVFGIRVPSLISSMLSLIGHTTSGVSLFAVGLLLAAYSVKLNDVVAVDMALKSIVQPVLAIALAMLFVVPNRLAHEAILAVALPPAAIAPMLAARYRTYESEAGSTMLLSTVLMVALVPVFMSIAA
ncbi:MAG: AEC family transporter [Silvibacterium sp.]|nr:AEC family transporter [Silvibacterium sp.]